MVVKIQLIGTQFNHYSDVVMDAMASQITSLTIVYSTFIQAEIKENIKAPRHWPLSWEVTGDHEFLAQGPVTRKRFTFDDVFITKWCVHLDAILDRMVS